MGTLDGLRAALLQRMGTRLGDQIARRVLVAASATGTSAGAALRELESMRGTLCGPPMQALFELPWLPLAIAAATLLHPWLGALAFAAALLLVLLGWINSRVTRPRLRRGHQLWTEAHDQAEAISRQADTVRAMGLLAALESRFAQAHSRALLEQQAAGEVGGWLGGLARACRFMVQAAAMGVGAALVVRGELTPGGLIAGSIIVARAVAPAEQVLVSWKGLAQLRDSAARLDTFLRAVATDRRPMPLPAPMGHLALEDVAVAAADGRPLLRNIAFELQPGSAMAIIGPSAAGKTTLCRVIAGCMTPTRGRVRLDGADYAHHRPEDRGPHVGYLPQEAVLFAGTVQANIARMAVDPDPELVVRAARLAGVHDMILRLPNGYDTVLAENGLPLSGGQRQRLGLARALYGRPRLVVLDEPNANLDAAGEAALGRGAQSSEGGWCDGGVRDASAEPGGACRSGPRARRGNHRAVRPPGRGHGPAAAPGPRRMTGSQPRGTTHV